MQVPALRCTSAAGRTARSFAKAVAEMYIAPDEIAQFRGLGRDTRGKLSRLDNLCELRRMALRD